MRRLLFMLALFACAGCGGNKTLYDRMNAAVAPKAGLQQTQLAHVGHIETADGRYEVCVQRLVVTGMLAPRGQKWLRLFTSDGRLAHTYPLSNADPAWCEGGRIYLFGFGNVAGIPVEALLVGRFAADELPTGNVLDFSRGVANAVMVREKRYGSSGGLDDLTEGRATGLKPVPRNSAE
jgi:hypothetical protein